MAKIYATVKIIVEDNQEPCTTVQEAKNEVECLLENNTVEYTEIVIGEQKTCLDTTEEENED